jgi:hypothetical protein
VVSLDRVVRVLLHGVQRGRDQLVEDPRIDRGAVGGDLDRRGPDLQRPSEERPRGSQISMTRQQDVDDLAVLVDRRYRYVQRPETFR